MTPARIDSTMRSNVTVGPDYAQGLAGDMFNGRKTSIYGGSNEIQRNIIAERLLGLDVAHRGPRRFGLRRHFRIEPWSDLGEVHWSPRAEAYVTPVADDEVGVALLGSMRGPWSDRLTDFPGLHERLATAEPVSAVMGAGPLRQRSRSRRAGQVLLVGDAGGYVDALTGEGIAIGLAQAEVAIRAIAANQPATYCAAAARVSLGTDLLTTALVTSTRTVTGRRTVLAAAHRVPWLFDRAVRTLASGSSVPRMPNCGV